MVIIFRKLRPLGIAPLGTVRHFLFFDFLELLLSVSDGELKIHTCCLGGVNIAEAVKAKAAKIKIVAFILPSKFKLSTNYELFAYILSFYLNNKGRGSMYISLLFMGLHIKADLQSSLPE